MLKIKFYLIGLLFLSLMSTGTAANAIDQGASPGAVIPVDQTPEELGIKLYQKPDTQIIPEQQPSEAPKDGSMVTTVFRVLEPKQLLLHVRMVGPDSPDILCNAVKGRGNPPDNTVFIWWCNGENQDYKFKFDRGRTYRATFTEGSDSGPMSKCAGRCWHIRKLAKLDEQTTPPTIVTADPKTGKVTRYILEGGRLITSDEKIDSVEHSGNTNERPRPARTDEGSGHETAN